MEDIDTTEDTICIQFNISEASAERLESLAESLDLEIIDLLNNAVTLLEWAIAETNAGYSIARVDPSDSTYSDVHIELLERIKNKRH